MNNLIIIGFDQIPNMNKPILSDFHKNTKNRNLRATQKKLECHLNRLGAKDI